MAGLSPSARRRSLKLKLTYIEEKVVRVQEELLRLEQQATQTNPTLFVPDHLGTKALRHQAGRRIAVASPSSMNYQSPRAK